MGREDVDEVTFFKCPFTKDAFCSGALCILYSEESGRCEYVDFVGKIKRGDG